MIESSALSEVLAPTVLEPGHAYIGRGDADVVIATRGRPDGGAIGSTDRLFLAPERAMPKMRRETPTWSPNADHREALHDGRASYQHSGNSRE
jgi:hypothetical protein